MALAAITATLTSQAPAPNPQDLSAYGMVCGPSSAGPLNVPTRLQSLGDCIPFGEGPGIQEAAELLQSGGSPVYFTRTAATTAGATGTVAKVGGAHSASDQATVELTPAPVRAEVKHTGIRWPSRRAISKGSWSCAG